MHPQPHSFEEAIRGCTAVVHTASPYIINLPRGKEMEMVVDPAITGNEIKVTLFLC